MSSEQQRADSERVDKLIGEVLANRYRIESRLGEGAMGSVYKARHVKVGRPFAVKVLHPRLLEQYSYRARITEAHQLDAEYPVDERAAHYDVVLAAIAAGRTELLRMHRSGCIDDDLLTILEHDLDLQEIAAQHGRG